MFSRFDTILECHGRTDGQMDGWMELLLLILLATINTIGGREEIKSSVFLAQRCEKRDRH